MRTSRIAVIAAALAIGAASTGLAQQPAKNQRDGKAKQEQVRQQRGIGALLKGIELSAEQKTQLQALRKDRGEKVRGERRNIEKPTDAQKQERREAMKQEREEMLRDVRAILTPAQREVFDRNVAEAQKKMEERRGKRGTRRS